MIKIEFCMLAALSITIFSRFNFCGCAWFPSAQLHCRIRFRTEVHNFKIGRQDLIIASRHVTGNEIFNF